MEGDWVMNRVTVTIAGRQFTLLTDGEVETTQRVAEYVDGKLTALQGEGKLSLMDACLLSAINITEDYFKELESSENLRRQLKEYLEENSKMKADLSEAKREIFALKGKQ